MTHSNRESRARRVRGLSALLVGMAVFALPIQAQTFYGSIVGTVTDTTGASVPGANVTLINTGTSDRRPGTTDSYGNYQFVNLVPGRYRVDIEKTGFKHFTREPIVVEVQSAVRIDASMEVGQVSQVMEVTAQTPLLQTESASLGHVIEARKVQDMPLNGRNVFALLALVPGVTGQGGTQGGGLGTNADNYRIGGGLGYQNAAFLDGAPMNSAYVDTMPYVLAQDAVQEFRVQTNNQSPEFGRFSGGVVNLTSKSGTNEFHGTAYEYLRNTVLNGNNFFSNRSGLKRPPFVMNQFGATAGGPIRKEKTFFFVSYEGLRLRQARSYVNNVPTDAMRAGDFSNLRDASGKLIPIYDPLTICGRLGNPACALDAKGNEILTRQPFAGNLIPPNRIDGTSKILAGFLWAKPNQPGQPFTFNQNFVANTAAGNDNNQVNGRIDQNVSDKQRMFGRYTMNRTGPINPDPYNNGAHVGNEPNFTQQGVFADTYNFTPTTIGDLRVSVMRWVNLRDSPFLGTDMTKWGWPASYNSQIIMPTIPVPCVGNYDGINMCGGDLGSVIHAFSNVYSLAPSLYKVWGRHTIKVGAEIRRTQFNFAQVNNTGGMFNFDNVFTSVNPNAPAGTGNAFASFLLGNGSGGNLIQVAPTSGQQMYEAFYASDTFNVTRKLTLSYGVRWELPFGWTEKYDRLTTLLPYAANPLAQATGLPLNGKLALVNSADRPDRHSTNNHWSLLAPRVGFAYRLTNKFVLRGGYGVSYLGNDIAFSTAPFNAPVNTVTTPWLPSLDGGITPNATLHNPFPNGIIAPLGHSPTFQSVLYGQGLTAPLASNPYAYTQQWNFNVEREFAEGFMMEVAYAGLRGVHLPAYTQSLDQLPDQLLSLGNKLQQLVPNPFYSLVQYGTLAQPTVAYGQLLRPFPEYTGFSVAAPTNRNSIYHSMQVKVDKRFQSGGTILVAYTYSKQISDLDSLTNWTESASPNSSAFNNNNIRADRSLSTLDVPQNLVVSYVLDLPVGKGKKLLSGASGAVNKLVSGWSINGISTFRSGFPLPLTLASNLTNSFGGSSRPNNNGHSANLSGSAQSRLNRWFDTSVFSEPAAFTFGNVSRTLPDTRAAGINNFDFAVYKDTALTERFHLQFRSEFYNLFNRVMFAFPATTLGLSSFGQVSGQSNSPRLVQFSLRLLY